MLPGLGFCKSDQYMQNPPSSTTCGNIHKLTTPKTSHNLQKTLDVRLTRLLTSLGPFIEMTSLKRKAEEQLTRSSVIALEVRHHRSVWEESR
jgi:hypothetical protein